jgi:hypothetical protein
VKIGVIVVTVLRSGTYYEELKTKIGQEEKRLKKRNK